MAMRRRATLLAALLCLAAPLAGARGHPKCAFPPRGSDKPVPTLDDMMSCQRKALETFRSEHKRLHGSLPTPVQEEEYRDLQRDEIRAFIEEHPNQTLIDRTEKAEEPAPQAREPRGPEASGSLNAILAYFSKAFGFAKGKLESLLKRTSPRGSPGETAETAGARKVIRRGLENAGIEKGDGIGDRSQALMKSVHKHNRDMDENLDPSMKKFYKKPGSKGRASGD